MKIYRRVIPKIAKDVVRVLLVNRAIEVEDGRRDEAELDIAGVLVKYLNDVDQLNNDAKEALIRHKLSSDSLGRVKKNIASKRKLVIGSGDLEFVQGLILDSLFSSANIQEVFAEDDDLKEMINGAMGKYLGVDAELDREVRNRLKNLREGTVEWESEYNLVIEQMRTSN